MTATHWEVTALPDAPRPVSIPFSIETDDPAVVELVERAAAEAGIEMRRVEPPIR